MTIYDENNVPILDRGPGAKIGLSQDALKIAAKHHSAAQKAIEGSGPDAYEKHLLTGESVAIHNKRPVGGNGDAAITHFSIGASTLDEALKEVIAAFDLAHLGEPTESVDHIYTPDWVASTHKELAALLGDYYSCEVRAIAEVV